MSVTVHSRLGDLLRGRNLTVRDLRRQLAARFGLTVDARTLDRLAQADRVRRTDLEIAATVAETLGVSLNDLFAVETGHAEAGIGRAVDGLVGEDDDVIASEQDDRLSELLDLQDRRTLTADERAEVQALVAAWGRRVREQGIRSIAAKRGLPVERVRAELDADLDRMMAWRQELEADPARLEALVQESWERQRARAAR